MRKLYLKELTDLILPAECLVCTKEGHWWCDKTEIPWPRCLACRKNYHPTTRILGCNRVSVPLVSIGGYENPVLRKAIQSWKYDGYWAMSEDWGRLLAERLDCFFPLDVQLVPIPLFWPRALARGYNQSEILARDIERVSSRSVAKNALRRVRGGSPQVQLKHEDRKVNIRNVFSARRAPENNLALLIDDVVTTGATIKEATRVLADAGWQVVGVAAVAIASHPDREYNY